MKDDFVPGDVILHEWGGKDVRYTVADPARTSRGKLRLERETGTIYKTWWRPDRLPKRYHREIDPRGDPVFERYTERARQVVVLAQDEARKLKHNYIGTEHLLLGLLREEEGLAARVLESLDVTVGEVREEITRIVGPGSEITTGQIPFTPRAKKVLELGLREALSLGHNYIGTEHVLLGLIRENEGVAARVLIDFDATPEKIRNEIIRMLSGPGRLPIVPDPDVPQVVTGTRVAAELEEYGRTIKANPLIEIIEAALGVSSLLKLSTEQPPSQRAMMLSPAAALRQQADEIERTDKAIRRFRWALKRFGGVERT